MGINTNIAEVFTVPGATSVRAMSLISDCTLLLAPLSDQTLSSSQTGGPPSTGSYLFTYNVCNLAEKTWGASHRGTPDPNRYAYQVQIPAGSSLVPELVWDFTVSEKHLWVNMIYTTPAPETKAGGFELKSRLAVAPMEKILALEDGPGPGVWVYGDLNCIVYPLPMTIVMDVDEATVDHSALSLQPAGNGHRVLACTLSGNLF